MIFNKRLLKAYFVALLMPVTAANAEIILHGTRAVYPSDAREITLQMSNNGEKPSLVQAWIDEGDPKTTPDKSKAPFVITPPITRVEAGEGQSLRISQLPTAQSLSKDRETLFWLNVLDIPPKPAKNDKAAPENYLQLAIRSRIKFFYRPDSIKTDSSAAPKLLSWTIKGNQLTVNNPTPFYITLTSVVQKQKNSDKTLALSDGMMLSPFSEQKISLNSAGVDIKDIKFTTINDYGGRVEHSVE